jgi:hypothetical protein
MSPGPAVADDPDARGRARAELGVPADALVLGSLAHGGDPARSAERVIAAAGWLDLWGHDPLVLLPGWTAPADRDRLVHLASDLGCRRDPLFASGTGEHGIALLVESCDVLVHLGEPDEGDGPESAWTAGRRTLLTSSGGPAGGPGRRVDPDVTPLLLAEEVLEAVATRGPARPGQEPSPARSDVQAGSAPPGAGWAEQVLELAREAP